MVHGLRTVRLKIIGNDIIKNVGNYQSCMVSKLPIIFKRTRVRGLSSLRPGFAFWVRRARRFAYLGVSLMRIVRHLLNPIQS